MSPQGTKEGGMAAVQQIAKSMKGNSEREEKTIKGEIKAADRKKQASGRK